MTVLEGITNYDKRMLLWCSKSRYSPRLITFFRVVSHTGDGLMQVLLPVLLLLISYQTHISFVLLVMFSFTIERLFYFILKNSLKRPRPPEAIPSFTSIICPSDQFSFPSGHTMASFLLAALFYAYLGSLALPLFVWAFLVAVSRVVLGVHFPTDIVAGATIGCLISSGCLVVLGVNY